MLLLSVTYFFFFFIYFNFELLVTFTLQNFIKDELHFFTYELWKHTVSILDEQSCLYMEKSFHLSEISPSLRWDLSWVGWIYSYINSLTWVGWFFSYSLRINLPKVNKRNTRKRREIFSKLKIKTPERPQCGRSSVFIDSLEHISHLALVFQSLTFNM